MIGENSFGEMLQKFRMRKGKVWTQAYTAKKIGVALNTYSAWELGKGLPQPKHRLRIIEVLRLTQDEADTISRAAGQVPEKICDLPLRRNIFFTGRQTQLRTVGVLLQERDDISLTQPVCISGLGGIGKTQIALEYAYSSYHNGVYRAVLWVNATDRTTIEASYLSLAKQLHLIEYDDREIAYTVQAVKGWMEENKKWLLIMDNADDLYVALSFFPVEYNGHILVTTRSQIVGTLTTAPKQIEIEAMEPEEGLRFLLLRSKKPKKEITPDTISQAAKLVALLGAHPLALDKAGAYIEETAISFTEYAASYHEHRNFLLHRQGLFKSEHYEPFTTTIEMSIRRAAELHPVAVDVLSFCAFLQTDDIPQELLEWEGKLGLDIIALREAIAALRRHSLIQINQQRKSLSIHCLVQAVVVEGMAIQDRQRWRERVIRILSAAVVEACQLSAWMWVYEQILLPHVLFCMSWESATVGAIEDTVLMLLAVGDHKASPQGARVFFEQALVLSDTYLGIGHPLSVLSAHVLGYSYYFERMYDDAQPLYERVLAVYEKSGDENDLLQMCLRQLAVICAAKDEYERAISLWQHQPTSDSRTSEEVRVLLLRCIEHPIARSFRKPTIPSIEPEHPAKYKMHQAMRERQKQFDNEIWTPLSNEISKLPKSNPDDFML